MYHRLCMARAQKSNVCAEEDHGAAVNVIQWSRLMDLNAHPTSSIMTHWRAWTPYRETKSKMKTHLQSCIRSNVTPNLPI